jgi:lipopolysaccharide transport system ATP-binding protein
MSVRLGFAVAVLGSPEILLVDEVLAVGDIAFQKKCYERINALKNEGTTILLVSHTPGAIWAICNKGLVLQKGSSIGVTPVEDTCKQYEYYNFLERAKNNAGKMTDALPCDYGGSRGGTGEIIMKKLEILSEAYEPIAAVEYGHSFVLRYHIISQIEVNECIVRAVIDAEINKAIVVIDNYEIHRKFYHFIPGNYTLDIYVKNPKLRPGVYTFNGGIVKKDVGVHLYFAFNQASLVVKPPADIFFYADFRASYHIDAEYKYF